jgi:membrane protease YdiL (CAAX protease family)
MTQATSEVRPPRATSPSWLVRRPLVAYFILAYALTWVLLLPFVLSQGGGVGVIPLATPSDASGLAYLLVFVGALGPALAAIIVSAASNGWAGVKSLLLRMVLVKVGIRWYLVALLLPLVAYVLPLLLLGGSAFVSSLLSVQGAITLLLYLLLSTIGWVIASPLGEEPGWRGFALPRLQEQYGPLRGSLLLGLLWGLWHLPLFLTTWEKPYESPLGLLLFLVQTISFTVVMAWLFNHTRGSTFLALLCHSAYAASRVFLFLLFPQASVNAIRPGTAMLTLGLLAFSLTWTAIAGIVIALTKGRLSYTSPVASLGLQSSRQG